MPRVLACFGLVLLAACARPAPPDTDVSFRTAGTPIYSNAVTAPGALAGQWRQVAEFAAPGAPPCEADGLTIAEDANGLRIAADLCLAGRTARHSGPMQVTGPGRLRATGADPAGLGVEWWVLWVDADLRTLVLGTPSGRYGMILNRDAVLPPDRAAAARDILAWNGYDLTRLRPVPSR
jgi:apolipoprotein D and lipocalin family protein